MCKTILTVLSLLLSFAVFAQCSFEADIEMSPSSETGIYCPYDTIKLNIAEPFDSYQWYYDFDGSASDLTPIAGATASAIEIPAGEYGYAFFYVELSREGESAAFRIIKN